MNINHHTTTEEASEIATSTARAWATCDNEGIQYAMLKNCQIEALVLLASGHDDESDENHAGITDEAIDALCERVGAARARDLCGVE